ncbi:ATP-dependent RNA helicase DBP2 [Symbiodinium microadriaticum]|uniref:RNA helicase n=1 Tax=Symbiodinium microadriaticum TaxID=2951 RepID=A0A1Q9DBR7_SYMMI|nr:ATP-dependent RNA helicase DBP2 [Symbiodinium microadriaticum]
MWLYRCFLSMAEIKEKEREHSASLAMEASVGAEDAMEAVQCCSEPNEERKLIQEEIELFHMYVTRQMLNYINAVMLTAMATVQLNVILLGHPQWVSIPQMWTLVSYAAFLALVQVCPRLNHGKSLNLQYLLHSGFGLLYLSPTHVGPEYFQRFSLLVVTFVRVPSVLFPTNIGMVMMVNGLYMLLTLLRTRFEDGWGEGLVPTAANVARNELLSCVGVLGFAVVLRKMIWLKVELRLDRGNMEAQLSAASSLLRLTCDAVLELDQASDSSTSPREDISAHAFHTRLVDSCSSKVCTEVFQVKYARMDGSDFAMPDEDLAAFQAASKMFMDIDMGGLLVHAASSTIAHLAGNALADVFPSTHTTQLLQRLCMEAELPYGRGEAIPKRIFTYEDMPVSLGHSDKAKISGTMQVFITRFGRVHILMAFGLTQDRPGGPPETVYEEALPDPVPAHVKLTWEPDPTKQRFNSCGFPKQIMASIFNLGFAAPTPIQAYCWPVAGAGRDVVGIAKTGSGKTLAFLLPPFTSFLGVRPSGGPSMLVMAPTRELAVQIQLNDYLEGGELKLDWCRNLVLDEADRMLDMGFEPQKLGGATWPREVRNLAQDYLHRPVYIQIGSHEATANKDIKQEVMICNGQRDKTENLMEILSGVDRQERVIVFTNTKKLCESLASELYRSRFHVVTIHGDKEQRERDQALHSFKTGRTPIMLATDVAASRLQPSRAAAVEAAATKMG